MSTISSATVRWQNLAGAALLAAAAAIKNWWCTYINWRLRQAAVAHLESLSDRQLKDIGLTRSQIRSAVSHGLAARAYPLVPSF
jgi:uncharacterized protein YjiS (DUF1127 family)